jgi:PAS domain-containing protein
MVLLLADGTIQACNGVAEEILEFTLEQIQDHDSLDCIWQTIHEDGSPFPGETYPVAIALSTGESVLGMVKNYQMSRHVPILLVTGQGNESLAVQILKAGAEDYLIKGDLSAADLQNAIAEAIDRTDLRLRLRQSRERERLVARIAEQIRQSLDLTTILNTTVEEVRQLFDTDRVLIFQFNPDWSGTVIAESVGAEWKAVLSEKITDPCLATTCVKQYQQGQESAIADIHSNDIDPCHVEILAGFQVQANLVVPILQDDQLWGLLIAHHCAAPRSWQSAEIELLKQLSSQVGTAIQQAELYQQSQSELAERRRVEMVYLRKSCNSY